MNTHRFLKGAFNALAGLSLTSVVVWVGLASAVSFPNEIRPSTWATQIASRRGKRYVPV